MLKSELELVDFSSEAKEAAPHLSDCFGSSQERNRFRGDAVSPLWASVDTVAAIRCDGGNRGTGREEGRYGAKRV